MEFIHAREHLNEGDIVEVDCDTQSNVMITDDLNFAHFKAGRAYEYWGGFKKFFPVEIAAPRGGYWNITIDVGEGYEASIKYNIRIIRG